MALQEIFRRAMGRVIAYRQCGVCKASGKSLGPNTVKASMCEQSLSLSLKDNVCEIQYDIKKKDPKKN